MKKILTIVIPTYNMEKYLDRCLSSLIISPELMKSVEVLVVNDGSTDNSSTIAHSYEDRYPLTFRVIDKTNGHYGSCVNRGVAEGKGKYIKVLDADDLFDTINFENFVRFLLDTDVDCIITDFVQINEKLVPFKKVSWPFKPKIIFGIEEITGKTIFMHAVCYRLENLRKVNYKQSEGISYSDVEFVYLPIAVSKRLIYYPTVVYKYLIGRQDQSVSSKVIERNFGNIVKVSDSILDTYIMASKMPELNKEFLYICLLQRMTGMYADYIINYKSNACQAEVVNLDKKIENQLPDVYFYLNSVVVPDYYFRYRYIYNWRKDYSKEKFAVYWVRFWVKAKRKVRVRKFVRDIIRIVVGRPL